MALVVRLRAVGVPARPGVGATGNTWAAACVRNGRRFVMSGVRACPIVLSASQRHRLKRVARTATAEHRQVIRATIVLLAARGLPNSVIAAWVGVCVDTARTWRARFAAGGEAGLGDRDRPGAPAPVQRCAAGAGQSDRV